MTFLLQSGTGTEMCIKERDQNGECLKPYHVLWRLIDRTGGGRCFEWLKPCPVQKRLDLFYVLSEGRTNNNDWMNATDATGRWILDKHQWFFQSKSYVKMELSISGSRMYPTLTLEQLLSGPLSEVICCNRPSAWFLQTLRFNDDAGCVSTTDMLSLNTLPLSFILISSLALTF